MKSPVIVKGRLNKAATCLKITPLLSMILRFRFLFPCVDIFKRFQRFEAFTVIISILLDQFFGSFSFLSSLEFKFPNV